MYPKRSKVYRAILAGVLQVIAALLAITAFIISSAFQLAASFFFGGRAPSSGTHFLACAVITAFFIFCASRNFSLASRCQKILRRIGTKSGDPIPVTELASLTRRPADKLLVDIQVMIEKEYFPLPVQLDLYRQLLVPGTDAPVIPPDPDPESPYAYKEAATRSKFPFAAALFVLAAYCLIFGLNDISGLFVVYAVLIAGVSFFLSYRCTVPVKHLVRVKKTDLPRQPVSTGNRDTDEALEAAIKQLEHLKKLNRSITNTKTDAGIQKLLTISQEIFAYVKDHPEKLRQTRQFMNYYLPTTIKLLDTYEQFTRQQVKGENISSSMVKIENMIDSIVHAFKKELDNLYYDKAVDISTEIDVMQSMLNQEGIGAADILDMDITQK